MIRTCDSNDVRATVFELPVCGQQYDDVDHSTVCPHEEILTREDRLRDVRKKIDEVRSLPCSCGECVDDEQLAALAALTDDQLDQLLDVLS